MQWTMDNMTEVISEGVNNTRDNDTLTSRIVIPGNQSGIDAINYTCTTDFRIQEKPSDTTANNIPMYKHTWTYTAGRSYFKYNYLLHNMLQVKFELCRWSQ